MNVGGYDFVGYELWSCGLGGIECCRFLHTFSCINLELRRNVNVMAGHFLNLLYLFFCEKGCHCKYLLACTRIAFHIVPSHGREYFCLFYDGPFETVIEP